MNLHFFAGFFVALIKFFKENETYLRFSDCLFSN